MSGMKKDNSVAFVLRLSCAMTTLKTLGEEHWTSRNVDARVTIVHPAARGLRDPGLVLKRSRDRACGALVPTALVLGSTSSLVEPAYFYRINQDCRALPNATNFAAYSQGRLLI
jgi:hypothetical protein